MRFFPTIRRRTRRESGQVLVWIAVSAVALLAMVGFVVDVGHLFNAHRVLQASADAAALAGAQDLPNTTTATNTAIAFSSSNGQKNVHPDLTNVTTTVTPKCFTSTGLPCNPANGIVVQESANVPTFFLKVIGINSFSISARGTASAKGGEAIPLDIMIVLDRTGSMCQPCSKISNAKAGVLAFLSAMRPSSDKIGLAVLPPATSVAQRCNTPPSTNANYDTSTYPYVIVPLSSDFRLNDSAPLNNASNLVQTVNCVQTNGGTAYTTALDQAQAALDAQGRPDAQDVIIFFTDGEANYGPWYYGNNSAYRKQPCHSAISSANTFKGRAFKPTWIYTIGYDTDQTVRCMGYKSTGTQGGQSCAVNQGKQFPCDEQPIITAYSTLQQMASTIDGALKFYYQPTNGELTTIFQRVALDLTMVRLVDDDTP
jgi:Flp pilus assembly protein TadG